MKVKPNLDLEIAAIRAAILEASTAAQAYVNEYPNAWYPCGFAWVKIKPARGRLVEALKELKIGHTSEEGGYVVWNPSENPTQAMYAKGAGARAFKNSLVLHLLAHPSKTLYRISAATRMD